MSAGEPLRDELRAFLKKLSGAAAIADDEELFARGLLNSLYALQLVQFVESRFQLALRDDELDLANFHSIEAIARLIERRAEG
jgi:acyl carrier protein